VSISRTSATALKVIITTQQAPGASGPWTNAASTTRYFGEVGGID
jgi:hypothetical protein